MEFWRELWSEYRELAKSLVGVALELLLILAVVKIGGWLIGLMHIEPSCNASEWIDCAHTAVLLFAWVLLLGSFVVVAAIFTIKHTARRIKDIDIAERLQDGKDYTAAITGALASLEERAHDTDRMRAIQNLLDLREKHVTDRKVAIFLCRLYKARKDYEGAISAASFFISAKEKLGKQDLDWADLLYNRACYKALLAESLQGEPKTTTINGALDDLEKSITMSRDNADAARSDPDFASLRTDARFISLTRVV